MTRTNRIHWHVKNIPASTTSFGVNATLPTGATILKNTVDRNAVPRPFPVGSQPDWVRSNGYSGPQPDNNTNNLYRFNVIAPVSYTHLRAHETRHDLVCRLLLEKKKN